MTPGFAIRNTTGPYAGDVWECSRLNTRDEYETFRLTLGDPDAFEVIQLDEDGEATA